MLGPPRVYFLRVVFAQIAANNSRNNLQNDSPVFLLELGDTVSSLNHWRLETCSKTLERLLYGTVPGAGFLPDVFMVPRTA